MRWKSPYKVAAIEVQGPRVTCGTPDCSIVEVWGELGDLAAADLLLALLMKSSRVWCHDLGVEVIWTKVVSLWRKTVQKSPFKSEIYERVICLTSDGQEVPSPATQMSLSVGYRHHIVPVVVSCEILLDCYFFFPVLRLKKWTNYVSVWGAWRENDLLSSLLFLPVLKMLL